MLQTILPTPKHTELLEGLSLVKPAIYTDHLPFATHLGVFAAAMETLHGVPVEQQPGGIRVRYDPELPANAYTLPERLARLLAET